MGFPSREPNVLGNTSLDSFDAIVIGSGAGGSAAAYVLATHGKKVLVIEAGNNYFPGLDDPAPDQPVPLFSNDELKLTERFFVSPDPLLYPRSFRQTEADGVRTLTGDVNGLPRTVGGGAVHADMKYPRLQDWDFRIRSEIGEVADANFADWPLTYDELEPFYTEVEQVVGVQGLENSDPFAPKRSRPYPMPPGAPMYAGLLAADGATKAGYHPFPYPTAVNSRPYRGRPPCVDCGFCSGYGCPNNSKCSPAVTFLRDALLTGNCQVRYNATVKLLTRGAGRSIAAAYYFDADGNKQRATADVFILAASAIESARLCLLSDTGGPGLGNSSGAVGRNLMFHFQNICVGFFKQRIHGHRGRSVTHGMADFRGMPGDPNHPLGGIIEFGTASELIAEAKNVAFSLSGRGEAFAALMRDSPFRDRIVALTMQAEDAPQLTNYVDLDPEVRDVYGLHVPRITYKNHAMELASRDFYGPKMVDMLGLAGAQFAFVAPMDVPPASKHIMGTMRMGSDPSSSVCDAYGKLHDFDNLYCADGGVFVTSSGYNPTLTIQALALRTAGNIVFPGSPQRALRA